MKAIFSGRCRAAMAALVFMMANAERNDIFSLSHIADSVGVSLSYLEQIFSSLRQANLVNSIRGPGGGYHLSRSPGTITITDVIFALEPPVEASPFQTLICAQLNNVKLEQMVNFSNEIF